MQIGCCLAICQFFLLSVIAFQDKDVNPVENKFEVDLEATWKSSPFQLNLLESITGYNESLFISTLSSIIGFSTEENESDEESNEEVESSLLSDSQMYNKVIDALNLDDTSKSFIGFNLVNKVFTPRIQAHYEYYNNVVDPQYSPRLNKECSTDSFGNKILSGESDKHRAWILYNDKLYCSSDEVFALKTNKKAISADDILPFDRVIGSNQDSPLLVLYGDIESEIFKSMFINLYESAKIGKLRFTWRYIPTSNSNQREQLSGYGADLTLKRTDYIVIDDRDVNKVESLNERNTANNNYRLDKDLLKIAKLDELKPISKDNTTDLGLKLTSFVLSNDYSDISNYELLNTILQDFPKFAYYVSHLDPENIESVKENVDANVKLGMSEESNGIYINGSPINKLELDIFKLVDKVRDELKLVNELKALGFTTSQGKKLLYKFALLSAVKESQFRTGNTIMGGNENRFKVYNYQFTPMSRHKKGGIVFFNDLEKDDVYESFPSSRKEAYLGFAAQHLRPGQIPLLRENIHDLIFALNFSDKEQLKVFFTFSKIILDKSLPQQIGLIARGGNEKDKTLAKIFYFIVDTASLKEGLAFLYQYFDAKDEETEREILAAVNIPTTYNFDESIYQDVLDKFSINTPSVICNGVIYELTSTWQVLMGKQLSQDIRLIQNHIQKGNDINKSLKGFLFENAKSERNLRIIPEDASLIKYKGINQELIDNSITFKSKKKENGVSATFWLIGDINSVNILSQFIEILRIMKVERSYSVQLRIMNKSTNGDILDEIQSLFSINLLSNNNIENMISLLSDKLQKSDNYMPDKNVIQLLEDNGLPPNHPILLLNGRYFRLDKKFSFKELQQLLEYEFSQRLNLFSDIISAYPQEFPKSFCEYYSSSHDCFDWFDLVSSYVTKSFHIDDNMFFTDVARFDFSSLNLNNILKVNKDEASSKAVDVLLIIDPIDENSQKLVSIINAIGSFPFVDIKILLQPQIEATEEVKIGRFYRGVYPPPIPQFDRKGRLEVRNKAEFEMVPSQELFTTNIDSPVRWQIVIDDSPPGVDLDNVKLSNYANSLIYGTYVLKNILIEGFAKNVKYGMNLSGLTLDLIKDKSHTDTTVMSNLGYFQLSANPGIWEFKIKPESKSQKYYSLLSASENVFISNTDPLDRVRVAVMNLNGLVLKPRFTTNPRYENKSIFEEDDNTESKEENKIGNFMKSLLKSKAPTKKQADINIFTIASGHLYERFLSIMTASVMAHTNKLVKFWIIENYISSHFKKLLPLLAQEYNFEYELITYKWPNWLRFQREKQRTIWGYKILFLDVLFPQDLKKVIFVDADQVARTDMKELVDIDLEGAPYGFTPMCDSRKDMEGFRFWKQGYWAHVLKDGLKYHISALYVVDLDKFRAISAGDRLRAHYQKLSSDPNSLSNLDQDLPNNMQNKIKIHSLPQEWLWCETWCSASEFNNAKTIDLCNNPLTKENKLERAKRQIPEWTTYDDQIKRLVDQINENENRKISTKESETTSHDSLHYEYDQSQSDDDVHDEL
ncbi:uncharacterized protein AC631_04294 [Debaryomyces fabryi]|uniref:UDP-glucose:glycoprotein glucosyltransferase n=1 Tax=Debaryomyces fabryi TaxID=58627 RepID=A0A0V1PV29_9ASCO|nr:uncharacterized protein AC631_04294 [Debaryomyces fabryi]KRZ99961.1 hypothetical protein AC631_04294 [Debaryomyces fabryi]CUM50610.1 unnamed protein product [Debaryomyces fabryi]